MCVYHDTVIVKCVDHHHSPPPPAHLAAAGLAKIPNHVAVKEAAPKSRAATVFNTRIVAACRWSCVLGGVAGVFALHCTRIHVRGDVIRVGVKDASLGKDV